MELSVENLQSVSGDDIRYIMLLTYGDKTANTRSFFVALQPITTDQKNPLATYEDKFIWCYAKKAIWLYNLSTYRIGSISALIKEDLAARGYMNTPEDQKTAQEVLKALYSKMAEAKRLTPMGLIDFRTFTVPETWRKELLEDEVNAFDHGNKIGSNTMSVAGSLPNHHTAADSNKHLACGYANNVVKRKEVTTATLKRTTKYDVPEAIKNLEAKIAAMKSGTYEPPKLPKIPGDDMPNTEKTETVKDFQYAEGCFCY
jgi:hypothetical protein